MVMSSRRTFHIHQCPEDWCSDLVNSNTPAAETAFNYDSLSGSGASPNTVSFFAIKRPGAVTQPASPATISRTNSTAPLSSLTAKHQLLKLRLEPLQRVETDLQIRLGASAWMSRMVLVPTLATEAKYMR